MKTLRKRAIKKAEKYLSQYEDYKEIAQNVGGTLKKDKNGKYCIHLRLDK